MTEHGHPGGGKGSQAQTRVKDTPSHCWEPYKNTELYNHKVYSEDLDYSFCNLHEPRLLDTVSHVLLVASTPLTPNNPSSSSPSSTEHLAVSLFISSHGLLNYGTLMTTCLGTDLSLAEYH